MKTTVKISVAMREGIEKALPYVNARSCVRFATMAIDSHLDAIAKAPLLGAQTYAQEINLPDTTWDKIRRVGSVCGIANAEVVRMCISRELSRIAIAQNQKEDDNCVEMNEDSMQAWLNNSEAK